MSLADWFRRAFLEVEHAAEAVIHFAEKEIVMNLPQAFTDALDRIIALLAAHTDQSAADAQTISGLQSDKAALQAQVADLTAQGAAKDGQIADLSQRLNDATSQISDMEDALLAVSPPAA